MKKKFLFILSFLLIFLVSCQENLPQKSTNNPSEKPPLEDTTSLAEDKKNTSLEDEQADNSPSKSSETQPYIPQQMIITLTGDTSVGSFFGEKIYFDTVFRQNGPAYFLKGLSKYFNEADINITNLENVFTDSTVSQSGKIYTYKAYSKEYLDVLTAYNIRYVNVVNNHMQDYLQAGFDESLNALTEKGIQYFGTNLVDCGDPELGSIKVHKTQVFEKGSIKLGLAGYYAFGSSHPSDETIKNDISDLRNQGCNFIIVAMHGGGQENHVILDRQKIMAHKFIDFGADMVYGHHPHALQAIEDYNGKKIYYSLGNFLFVNYRSSQNPETILLKLTLTMDEEGNITPTYENIPVLWMGTMTQNIYTPLEVTDPAIIQRIHGFLGI